jgi:hypothetical protein
MKRDVEPLASSSPRNMEFNDDGAFARVASRLP